MGTGGGGGVAIGVPRSDDFPGRDWGTRPTPDSVSGDEKRRGGRFISTGLGTVYPGVGVPTSVLGEGTFSGGVQDGMGVDGRESHRPTGREGSRASFTKTSKPTPGPGDSRVPAGGPWLPRRLTG